MRIIAGRHRGKRLEAFPGRDIRPTGERVREALFNILAHGPFPRTDGPPPLGARVLDAFAGTGTLGLEALSRGAAHAVFMDSDAQALKIVRGNIAACREQARATVLLTDAARPPRNGGAPCDLAFLDAPYNSGLAGPALAALTAQGWLANDAVAVVELEAREPFETPEGFAIADERRYGRTRLVFALRNML